MLLLKDLFQIRGVQEELAQYLTYRDSINVRKALNIDKIDCSFLVEDKDGMVQSIPFSSVFWDKLALTIDFSGSGQTWLKAGQEHNYSDLRQLVELGFDPNNQIYGYRYLYIAILEQNFELLTVLLDLGAQLSKFSDVGTMAILSESCELINLILDRGLDVNDSCNGRTLLIKAVTHGDYKTVDLLLKRGANPQAVDRFGKTALDHALSPDIITRLKEIK